MNSRTFWGYSDNGWTPILLRLSGLFVDVDPSTVDRNDFAIEDGNREEHIYEFLYLDGSILGGKASRQVGSSARKPNKCRSALA